MGQVLALPCLNLSTLSVVSRRIPPHQQIGAFHRNTGSAALCCLEGCVHRWMDEDQAADEDEAEAEAKATYLP